MSNSAQIHRFGEKVAIYIGTGETVYLSIDEAKQISQAMDDCIHDVSCFSFQDSKFKTFSLEGE